MKKILLFTICALMFIGFSDFKVDAISFEDQLLPEGINYLSDSRCYIVEESYDYRIEFYDRIRVKPNTDYAACSLTDVLVGEGNCKLKFFDISGKLIEEVSGLDDGFNFRTTADTYYLGGFFYFAIYGDPTEIENCSIDEIIVMYEGKNTIINQTTKYPFTGVKIDYTDTSGTCYGTYYCDIDDLVDIYDITEQITATDNYDGDVTDRITVDDSAYVNNRDTLGSYDVIYEVSDSSNNTSKFILTMKVVDITAPVCTSSNEYYVEPDEPVDLADIIATLKVRDNYDDVISPSQISVVSDGYTRNSNKTGHYQSIFKIEDSSNNAGRFVLNFYVRDTKKPVITGTNTYEVPSDTGTTTEAIKQQLTANDAYDGDVTSTITTLTDEYSGNERKVGTYNIVYRATDKSGNYSDYPVTVTVFDRTPPVFKIPSIIINITQGNNLLTVEKIESILYRANIINRSSDVEVLSQSVSDFQTEGSHNVTLLIDDEEYEMVVNVVPGLYEEVEVPKKVPNFFERVWNKVVSLFERIKSLF